ncbi:MAG: PqqD family protein [Bacteroidaceae bacterium]|nr:PqqD family protein [Bacteroidaceae bacterium]
MKVKKGFELQEVCGEFIIVPAGVENVDFSKIISLNESAADLWKSVAEMEEFSIDDMVKILLEQYEVDEQTAREDCAKIAERWKEMGLTE